jgi:hypothetical protein
MVKTRRITPWFLFLFLIPEFALAGEVTVHIYDADTAPVTSAIVVAVNGPRGRGELVLNQVKRRFEPRFLIAVQGQSLLIRNSDDALHNTHCDTPVLRFNIALQPGKSIRIKLPTPTSGIILCHVHAEMRARLLVLDSTLYGFTNSKGRLRLKDVPKAVTTFKVYSPHDGYSRPTRLDRKGDELKLQLKSRRPKKRPQSRPEKTLKSSLENYVKKLGELSAVLGQNNQALHSATDFDKWYKELFIGMGLRSALRRRVGRKNAYKLESRLRWVHESLKLSLSRKQAGAVKDVLEEAIRYLKSALKP